MASIGTMIAKRPTHITSLKSLLRPDAYLSPFITRSVGAITRREQPLSAGGHESPPPKARSRPRTAKTPADRNGGGLSAGGVAGVTLGLMQRIPGAWHAPPAEIGENPARDFYRSR